MRHVTVRRAALLLGAVLLAFAGFFAWLVGRQPARAPSSLPLPASTGAALFKAHCASCHTVESLRPGVIGPDARRHEIEVFLMDHGDASDADDRLILDYLTAAT